MGLINPDYAAEVIISSAILACFLPVGFAGLFGFIELLIKRIVRGAGVGLIYGIACATVFTYLSKNNATLPEYIIGGAILFILLKVLFKKTPLKYVLILTAFINIPAFPGINQTAQLIAQTGAQELVKDSIKDKIYRNSN